MCIPLRADGQASPHFALLDRIAARNGVGGLSMGMSVGFELGIQLGATHLRVGRVNFRAALSQVSRWQRRRIDHSRARAAKAW